MVDWGLKWQGIIWYFADPSQVLLFTGDVIIDIPYA